MEALTERFAGNGGDSVVPAPVSLATAIAAVRASVAAAPDHLALAGYVEAAEFAAHVEELSRSVDYAQILSAGAVDRTRTQAITNAAASRSTRTWTTGWDNGIETLNETDAAWPAGTTTDIAGIAVTPRAAGDARAVPCSPADDGCKTTAEFLRLRLRIGLGEAKRRLHLAHAILPETTLTGDQIPPAREHLAAAFTPATADPGTEDPRTEETTEPAFPAGSGPVLSSRAGTIITATLDRLKHHTTPETLNRIEHDLTRTAATADPDFLARVARRWADTLDTDGTEPTEEALRHTQGAFIRKPRHGLHHLEIFATTDQYEIFATIMNAATNPPHGIITALKAALTTNKLPTAGGNRPPPILATINYQDLLPHLPAANQSGTGTGTADGTDTNTGAGAGAGAGPGSSRAPSGAGTGTYVFSGPVAATTIRKLACDADIIPALLVVLC